MGTPLTITRGASVVTVAPSLTDEPELLGDENFATELTVSAASRRALPWLPHNSDDTPVFNLCAAAFACGADVVGTPASDSIEFTFHELDALESADAPDSDDDAPKLLGDAGWLDTLSEL